MPKSALKLNTAGGSRGKVVAPSCKRRMVDQTLKKHPISLRMACTVFHISVSTYLYQGIHVPENEIIADWLIRLTTAHKRWGFGLCFMYLRNIKQFSWNHKRIYRIIDNWN